jgi:HAD superfamily hydrolase (TIGR01509 family)
VHLKARGLGARLPDDWVPGFYVRLYAMLAEGTPLVPGILQVLDALDAAGIPYAVGSNGTDHKMQITLGQHPGLISRFGGRLYSGQTLGAPKPAPDLYLHAARALGCAPADCAVVEDSPPGARAAAAAGIPCFGFAPHGDGAALAAEGAHVFHSMADLPGLLGLR